MPVGIASSPNRGALGREVRLFCVQVQRRQRLFEELLLGVLLGLPEEAGGPLVGAEQLKIHCFIIRRSPHPLSPDIRNHSGLVCPEPIRKIIQDLRGIIPL